MKVASGFISSAVLALACVGLFNMGGCTTASGLDASSKFSCSAPDGVTCLSVSGIYANSKAGTLPAMQPKNAPSADGSMTSSAIPAANSGVVGQSGVASGSANGGQPREIVAYNAPANTVSFGGATQKTTAKAMSAPHSGAPLRTPERIVRVWMAPFEDAEGDLHDQKYFYVTVTPGSWTIEAARVNIKNTFQQVTPLSRNNPANRETDPDQIAQQQSRLAPPPGPPAGLPPGVPPDVMAEPPEPFDPLAPINQGVPIYPGVPMYPRMPVDQNLN